MNSCRCSAADFAPRCIVWREVGMGCLQMGDCSGSNREFKYYRLTEKGSKQFLVEESHWEQMAEAVARILWAAAKES